MNTKQVIVIRKDLNMRKGKMISMGAHASLKVFLDRSMQEHEKVLTISVTDAMINWMENNYKKITVSVDSEEELLEIYNKAKDAGIPCSLIIDSGLTEFNGVPTKTAVAIGPDEDKIIDPITKHLKLL